MTIESFIDYAAKIGYEGVELGYFWEDEEKEIAQVPVWLEKAGIELSGYIIGNRFAISDPEARQGEINKVKHAIDCASQLNAPLLRVFGGGGEGITFQSHKEIVLDCLKEVVEYGAGKQVKIALEDHHGTAATSEHLLYYYQQINSPWFGFTVDMGNFLTAGEDPVLSTKRCAPHAFYVHVKDYTKEGKSPIIGEGVVDLPGCFKELINAGYNGSFSIEYESETDYKIGIPKSFEYTKSLLDQLSK